MATDLSRGRTTIALIGIAITALPFIVSLFGLGHENTFDSPASWLVVAVGASIVCLTVRTRRTKCMWSVAVVVFIAVAYWKQTYFWPLQQAVVGASYNNAPLNEILENLSRDRTSRPFLRFVICDTETFGKPITVSFRDGTSLGQVLNQIAEAASCDYEWHWYSWCGNTYPPTDARFAFHSKGKPLTKGVWEVARHRVIVRDESGVVISDSLNNDTKP